MLAVAVRRRDWWFSERKEKFWIKMAEKRDINSSNCSSLNDNKSSIWKATEAIHESVSMTA